MPRYAKVLLWGCLALVVAVGLFVVIVATFNWNHAKPWINRQASELANRPVAIEGNLSVDWTRPIGQEGWRNWLPWPEVTAQQLTVGNPPRSAVAGNMAEVSNLIALINPLALLDNTIDLPRLAIDEANVVLDRDAEGANNWTFTQEGAEERAPSKWQFRLRQLQLSRARVHVMDAVSKVDMKAELDTLPQVTPEGYGMGFKATGSYNDAVIEGDGQLGDVLTLQAGSDPFPLQGRLNVGETRVAIEGSVTRPQDLAALDVRLTLAGNSMSDLYPLTGVALPNTPPYRTEGRLIGLLEGESDVWRYENFTGVVGQSDLGGTMEYHRRQPRPLLTGEVESKQLRFVDLGPLIGADTSAVKGKNETVLVKPPPGRVLPVDPISTQSWGAMDADVKFTGRRIIRGETLPLDNIEAHVRLEDSVLRLTPLNFGVAGGTISNTITMDGRGGTLQAEMGTQARGLQLRQLFAAAESMNASFGEVRGNAVLKGQGRSIAELLGSSNGSVQAVVSRGTVSSFLLEAAGLNVANVILVKLFGDEQVVLNCVAADLTVRDGLMQVGVFKLETEETTVDITGDINLRTEALDLDVRPANQSVRIFTLRSPLYARGTFQDPQVGVQAGPLAVRAGAAVALGVVATPFAALLPLLNTGTDDASNCSPVEGEGGQGQAAAGQAAEEVEPEPMIDVFGPTTPGP